MELVMKKVDALKGQPYNPPARTESTALAALFHSIKKSGIMVPILVNAKGEIIDGHRRVACAQKLGIKEVPCVVTDDASETMTAEKFEQVNTSQKKLGPRDMIFVFVNGGNVPPRVAASIGRLEALIGADELDEVAGMSISYRIIDNVQRVASYCHKAKDDEFKKKVFYWMLNTTSVWSATQAMAQGITPAQLTKHITADRPLKRVWGAEKKG